VHQHYAILGIAQPFRHDAGGTPADAAGRGMDFPFIGRRQTTVLFSLNSFN